MLHFDCGVIVFFRYFVSCLRPVKFLAAFWLLVLVAGSATCTTCDERTYSAWVLCQPDSYVNIRSSPSSRSCIEGRMFCGDEVETDGRSSGGFLHCVNLPCDSVEGWISEGYLVYSEPQEINSEASISANGRVACRRAIDGYRRCWARNGQVVEVYWHSEIWAVTNRGFIQMEFLLFPPEDPFIYKENSQASPGHSEDLPPSSTESDASYYGG